MKNRRNRNVSMPLVESQIALSLIGDLSEEVKQLTSIVTDLQAKVKRLSLKEDYEFKEFIKQKSSTRHPGFTLVESGSNWQMYSIDNASTICDDTNKFRTTTDISGNMVCGTLDPNFNLKLVNNSITYNTSNLPVTLTSPTHCVQQHLVSTSESWKDASPKDNIEPDHQNRSFTLESRIINGKPYNFGKYNSSIIPYYDFNTQIAFTKEGLDEYCKQLEEDDIKKNGKYNEDESQSLIRPLKSNTIQMTIFDRQTPDGNLQTFGKWTENGQLQYTDFLGCSWMNQKQYDEYYNDKTEERLLESKNKQKRLNKSLYKPGRFYSEKPPAGIEYEEFVTSLGETFYVVQKEQVYIETVGVTEKLLNRDKQTKISMKQANEEVANEIKLNTKMSGFERPDGTKMTMEEFEDWLKKPTGTISKEIKNNTYEREIPINTKNPNGTVLKDSPTKELKSNWNKVNKDFIDTLNVILSIEKNTKATIPVKFQCIKPALASKIKEKNIVYITSIYENEYEYLVDARSIVLIN